MNFSEIKISVNWFCMVFSEKQIESYNGMAQSVERWTAGQCWYCRYCWLPVHPRLFSRVFFFMYRY